VPHPDGASEIYLPLPDMHCDLTRPDPAARRSQPPAPSPRSPTSPRQAGERQGGTLRSGLLAVALSKICPVSPVHAYQQKSWGRRIVVAIGCIGALAAAGFVGSLVGPHFKASSASGPATTSTHPPSTTTSTVAHSAIRVLVANATKEPNAGAHFTQQLSQGGWSLSTPQNATSEASTTTVYYAPSRQQAAALIATEIGVPTTAVQPMSSAVPVATAAGLDVVVIIGSDLAGNGFPATTVPTT